MNWTPTGLLVLIIFVIVTTSLFCGYFGFETTWIGIVDPPENMVEILTNAVWFYFDLLIFSVEDIPVIFGVIWWVLHILGAYCIVKIIWPGA